MSNVKKCMLNVEPEMIFSTSQQLPAFGLALPASRDNKSGISIPNYPAHSHNKTISKFQSSSKFTKIY